VQEAKSRAVFMATKCAQHQAHAAGLPIHALKGN
jgi:hypothetical protein